MEHLLPPLPYQTNALSPLLSQEAVDFHYHKHHQAYVTNLNKLIVGTPFAEQTLENIVRYSAGPIFNNAGQVWNHNFYWLCLSPNGGKRPTGYLLTAIEQKFGSFEQFQQLFSQAATGLFGSGWAWLVQNNLGELSIVGSSNAGTPLQDPNLKPLLACDVWEHAYYIDYRNARNRYIEVFWDLVNWDFVALNLQK